jgi:hypothetical protein
MSPGYCAVPGGKMNNPGPFMPEHCEIFPACPPGSFTVSFTSERTVHYEQEHQGNIPGRPWSGVPSLWPGSALLPWAGTGNPPGGGRSP